MEQLVGFKVWYKDTASRVYTSPWPLFYEYNQTTKRIDLFEMEAKGGSLSAVSRDNRFLGVFPVGTTPEDYLMPWERV